MKKVLVAACLLITSHGFGLAQSTITIGDTIIEAAADGDKRSLLLAQQVALSQTATIHSLSFYVTAAHGELRLGIYDASGPGGAPGVRKAQTHSFAPQVGWNTHHVITPVSLAPGNYWLAYLPSGNKLGFVKQNNSGNCWYIQSDSNQVLPHTFPSNPISCNPTTWSFYATLKIDAPVNGQCGSANGKAVSSVPTTGLCSLGTASAVTGTGPWNWSCTGSNGGTTASCSAPYSPAPINGQCGPANGAAVSTAPTTGLCSVGLASSVTGTGPWNWACNGSNGGTTASCQAPTGKASGIIPANRMTTWVPGVTYNGGIPNRTTIYKTLSPNGSDDTAAIQAALNSCPANQVVQLTAGVFKITGGGLNFLTSNCTLRGVGPGKGLSTGINGVNNGNDVPGTYTVDPTATQLIKADRATDPNDAILYVGNDPSQFSTSINLAADAAQGTNSVTLVSNPGIAVGEIVYIDQNTDNDPDVFWGLAHDPPGGGSRRWFIRQDRSLTQIVEVTAVSGNTITFATPLHHTFKVAETAQLSRYAQPVLHGVGVEEIFFFGGMGGDYNGNVAMNLCAHCWIRHIEAVWSVGTSVGLYGTYRSELRDSFIHETPQPTPGGGGYLVGLVYGASDNLIENNIMWYGNKEIVARGTGGGNVIAYNYMDDAFGNGYPDLPEAGVNAGHYTTPHMELVEGNYSQNYKGDAYWGNSIDITVFRNHLTSLRAAHPPLNTYSYGGANYCDCGNRFAVDVQAHSYRTNFVGNVLGKQGQTLISGQGAFVFEHLNETPANAPGDANNDAIMWNIGSEQDPAGWAWVANTYTTQLRDGNWDWVTQSQTWLGIGGTQGSPLGTPKPIPNSMYLTSKPAFFGTNTWPWVDPSTGATYVLPAKARFEAGTPNG